MKHPTLQVVRGWRACGMCGMRLRHSPLQCSDPCRRHAPWRCHALPHVQVLTLTTFPDVYGSVRALCGALSQSAVALARTLALL
jgi:hypothetical protein